MASSLQEQPLSGARGDASGTLTFLFSDIEGSTVLLRRLGDGYADVLARCLDLIRAAITGAGGWEVDAEGDGLFCAFSSAADAVAAAVAAQRAHAAEPWPDGVAVRVRMGLHTGEALIRDGGYVGLDVHRAARVAAAGHGGQVLLSDTTRSLTIDRLPDGVTLRDLGTHRLRDLAHPEHLWQAVVDGLRSSFPALRTLDATPNNLPGQVTSFVGRQEEVQRARALLADSRLLTLTGPGGTGKTRLALQVAACLLDAFADGVFFVQLASVRDPSLVAPAVLSALGVPEASGRSPSAQLAEYLGDREVLLVLDNFEQLLDAAPEVGQLLEAAARLRVLVTSRAPLHLSGEQELGVPPLRLPAAEAAGDLAALAANDAVALFVQRARAVAPDFRLTADNAQAVAEICARLDGLPLAIELAAARVKLLPPEALLSRLERRLTALGVGPRDRPRRQQTLRDAIAWSYDLLDADGQRLFARLAVFVDGWTLEHAELICGRDGLDVLTGLESLVDHSLVRRRDAPDGLRFALLETIREFAAERLDASGERHELCAAHAEAFLALAEEAAGQLSGREQGRWARRLTAEQGNCRAALDSFADGGRVEQALRLGAALWRYWQKRSVHEGRARLAQVLALPGAEDHPRALIRALDAAGGLAYWDGDFDTMREHYERAVALADRVGDAAELANARYNLSFSWVISQRQDIERARALLADSLACYLSLGDRAGEAKVRWGIGVVATFAGEPEVARGPLTEALTIARELDDVFLVGWALHMLGTVDTTTGDYDRARAHLDEAVRLFADATDVAAIPLLLDDYAELAVQLGQPERAATLAGASVGLQRASGAVLARRASETMGRTPIDPDRFASAWQAGLRMSVEEAVAYALGTAPPAGTLQPPPAGALQPPPAEDP